MRIAIVGTGGVGGYFGARLAQSGEDVIFIARGKHLQAMLERGLHVESFLGNFIVSPVQASDNPGLVGKVDMILLAVKAWQVPEVSKDLHPMLAEGTGVVFIGNGVEAPEEISAILGSEHVLGGTCRISSFIAGAGRIRHVGIEPSVAFGELDGRLSQRVAALRESFERAGVKTSIPADIQIAIWEKFVFIAAISGVGAVTRAPAGVIRSLPGSRQMLESAMQEIVQVGHARNVNLEDKLVAKNMAFIDNMAPSVIPSMQRDIMAGMPSELESQNGAVVRLGLQVGISTPVNAFIYHSLLPQEMKARNEIHF